jgi:hypothetical protein
MRGYVLGQRLLLFLLHHGLGVFLADDGVRQVKRRAEELGLLRPAASDQAS